MAFSWLLNSKSVAELHVKDDGVLTHSFTEQVNFFDKKMGLIFVKKSCNFSFFLLVFSTFEDGIIFSHNSVLTKNYKYHNLYATCHYS